MEKALHDQFTEDDWRPPEKHPNEPNWANRTSYERAVMVREGLLEPVASAGYGQWALYRRHR